ncbi:hypothetical protein ABZZ79_30610 [Streptomyces sp. NPDC006458]|uniref:hypothetical protein n=1 Tax=Streptomyces sp. NPDC006458 TaxID=3154302 RepID=UPI0033AAA735
MYADPSAERGGGSGSGTRATLLRALHDSAGAALPAAPTALTPVSAFDALYVYAAPGWCTRRIC